MNVKFQSELDIGGHETCSDLTIQIVRDNTGPDVPGGGHTVAHALSEHNLERQTLAAITHSPNLGVELQVGLAARLNSTLVTLELCRGSTQPALPCDHLVGHHEC